MGLLDLETFLEGGKIVRPAEGRISLGASGRLAPLAGLALRGYEIHCGRTGPSPPTAGRGGAETQEFTLLDAVGPSMDGAQSPDGGVWGTYLHGIFASDAFRAAWLSSLGGEARVRDAAAQVDKALDRLADAVAASLDIDALKAVIGMEGKRETQEEEK